MRYAIVDSNNHILYVIEYDDPPTTPPPGFPEGTTAIAHDLVSMNWTYDGSIFIAPPIVPSTYIPDISDRQFFQQLAIAGIITQNDAIAAVATGTIPPAMVPLVESLPRDEQFSAKMILSGATTFKRDHPMTIAIGTAYGMSSDQIDAFFQAAVLL